MRNTRAAALALPTAAATPVGARAQPPDGLVKVGVLTDLSGPYAGLACPGSVVAARMAAEDHNGGLALSAMPLRSSGCGARRRRAP